MRGTREKINVGSWEVRQAQAELDDLDCGILPLAGEEVRALAEAADGR